MKRLLLIIMVSFCISLPMFSQQKKASVPQQKKIATSQQRKTIASKPKKTTFDFKLQFNATFKKDGENNYYVLDFGKKSAHQLYMDVLSNIASIYRNPDRVTSKVENRSIVINGYADEIAWYKDLYDYTTSVSFNYRIDLQFKDGKIRVNAPTLQEIYTSSASGNKTLSDQGSVAIGMNHEFGTHKDVFETIDKYLNMVITSVVYGSKDDDW